MERPGHTFRALPRLRIDLQRSVDSVPDQNASSSPTVSSSGKMDEPLLGRSANRKIVRKSDHPLLSLISPSPRRRSEVWALDASSSPASSPRGNNEQVRRPDRLQHDTSFKHAYHGRRDSPTAAASSFMSFGSRSSTPGSSGTTLLGIPEESSPRNSGSLGGFPHGAPYDLEALFREEPNDFASDESRSEVFGEPLSDDAEGGRGQEECRTHWARSGLTKLLLSAIPEVLDALSSSPDDDLFDYNPGEPLDDRHLETSSKACSVTGFHYSSLPSLPSHPPLGSPPGDETLAEPATPGLPNPALAKDDSHLQGVGNQAEEPLLQTLSGKKKGHLHKCRTAPMLTGLAKFHPKAEKTVQSPKSTPQSTTGLVVWQASLGLCIYLAVGVIVYTWKREEFTGFQTVGVIDALYFCIVTMCTIGYGDITPVTPVAKILSCALVFVGFGFIDALMSGMLTVVLDRQEHMLLNVVEDGHHERAKNYIMDSKKGRMRIRMKVALAIGTVLLAVSIGVLFLHHIEDLKWIDAVYFTSISITTVGFGDYSFQTMWGRLFAAVWLLLSTLMVARAFLFLAEARVHRRSRQLAKRILQRKMTSNDLMSMDLDNDGHISKSEFVVYKLKELGKISQGDVLEICKEFDVIDNTGSGKITLARLLDGSEE